MLQLQYLDLEPISYPTAYAELTVQLTNHVFITLFQNLDLQIPRVLYSFTSHVCWGVSCWNTFTTIKLIEK